MFQPAKYQSGRLGVFLVLAVSSLAITVETPAFAQPQPQDIQIFTPDSSSPPPPEPAARPVPPAEVNPRVQNPRPSIFREPPYNRYYEAQAPRPPQKPGKRPHKKGPRPDQEPAKAPRPDGRNGPPPPRARGNEVAPPPPARGNEAAPPPPAPQ
ncbi:hypothetical protein [Brasilonema octagenarum]|uniref:Uncharacterized protein n=1 Tax=Brasilonema octagenarum UFV-OR1 TaxID=417115 RepID=A0ABX1M6Z8_9CYAN|nr:hypothetical protein [Brasilonema octagenarum]NMF63223.1 hypothetical protein [Brasilonema octagenarum UFV-OR1]